MSYKIVAMHKFVDEIGHIQARFKEIDTDRGDITLPIRPPVLADIDPDIVGFKADRNHLVKELLDERTLRDVMWFQFGDSVDSERLLLHKKCTIAYVGAASDELKFC